MAQKFSSLEEAAQQLGISKERLSELREANKIRAYRDGASWKFRSDDIERLQSDGIPTLDPPASDIDLGSGLGLGSGFSFDSGIGLSNIEAESSGIDLAGAEDILPAAGASDLSLDDIEEPTLAGDDDSAEVLALDPDDDLLNLTDSILLSEKELGGSIGRPPSTIIGKADLDPDLDLALASSSSKPAGKSDVRLAETSNVLGTPDDDLLLELEPLESGSDNFKGLAEVDVDLEAESSRILSGSESQKAKEAIKGATKRMPAAESSDLELAATSSITVQPGTSDISLDVGSSKSSLTGLSALELDDDDDVLGDGSDITLSAASSGINIISPSDSGLALDDVALNASSMSSPLDLGAGDDEAELQPLELSDDDMAGEEPFQLTPMGEIDDEEKDSSQVIALDEMSDEEEGAGVVFQPSGGDDFGAVGISPGVAPVAVAADDVAVSGVVMGMLTLAVVLLLMCGTMMYDLVLNMWSWGGATSINSYLMDQLSSAL